MTDIFIEGGRALLGNEISETSLRIAGREIAPSVRTTAAARLGIDARGLAGAAGHRRSAWRCVRAADDAAPRRRFPDRRRAGRQRPAGDQQRHHHRLSRHDLVVGARPAQRRQCAADCWRRSKRCGRSSPPTPASICATRPTISMPRPKSSNGCRRAASTCSPSTTTWTATVADLAKPQKRSRMVERTGLSSEAFDKLVERVVSRAHDVPASIARLAQAARAADVRMLSHDDASPAMRQAFRAQGVDIAEFPVNEETAREAAAAGDFIVFGAPNVVRGGSHTGWTRASDMIAKGLCSVLASDYYYPAQLLAAFRLAADGVLPLAQGLAADLGGTGPRRRPHRPRRARRRPARRHHAGRRQDAAAAAHRRGHRRRTAGASDRRRPPAHFIRHAAQGSCGRVKRLYSGAMADLSPLRNLLCRRAPAANSTASAQRLLGYDAYGGDDLPFPDGVTQAMPDWRDLTAGSPQIRLSRHAEGADGAGAGQDRSRAHRGLRSLCRQRRGRSRSIKPVVDSISGFIAVIPAEPHATARATCRRLRPRIRFLPRAADDARIARGAIPRS